MTFPAYTKDLLARRRSGVPIAALVIALNDWNVGHWFAGKDSVSRVVVPDDVPMLAVNWSFCTALDCVIVGLPEDDASFYGAARLLHAAGAASVWGSFPDGFWRLRPWRMAPHIWADVGPIDQFDLLEKIASLRDLALLEASGIYGQPLFREARIFTFGRVFGPAIEQKLRARLAA